MTLGVPPFASANEFKNSIQWEQLPSLPDKEGFAGAFAGVNNGALIVGGGANFPYKRPWEGGTKTWYDSVFVLEGLHGEWKTGFKLPRPLGYGVSITYKGGILCMGGSDATNHHSGVFSLSWAHGKLTTSPLPDLPKPCANMCGALVGDTVYLAGGIETPNATNALKTFWSLDLAEPKAVWRELPPWPGPERMLAVAGACDGDFFLFGGASLKVGSDKKVTREWLRDAYRFNPVKGWKRIVDLPRAAVAAPSPAPLVTNSLLLVLGGDDGSQVNSSPTNHHGFAREILAYDSRADKWLKHGETPFALVTTPAVRWNSRIIVPGGEARPGIRSVDVWSGVSPE